MGNNDVYISVAGLTDIGLSRTNNEDSFLLADFRNGNTFPNNTNLTTSFSECSFLLVVSDGVGGSVSGEIASQLTVHAINDSLGRLSWAIAAHDRLIASVEQANYIVWNCGKDVPAYKGMSATVTAILIEEDAAYIAQVGDSRAYLIRQNRVTQITTDQSLVELLISKGILTPEEASQHPRKNVILQAIGLEEIIQVDVRKLCLQQKDYLIVCSDGLSNNVLESEMLQIIKNAATLPEACQQLVTLANERGGKDNITVTIAYLTGEGLPQTSSRELTRPPSVTPLFTFDPDRDPEKSHKRTRLLSDPSVCVLEENAAILENLSTYPNTEDIQERYKKLSFLLNDALEILGEQQYEVELVNHWVKVQQAIYPRMPDLENKMILAREHIEQAWKMLEEVTSEFRTKT
ncbi:MAG: serine/threonine-protein phosphatase [Acidobacteria bacterium]|nr:serine/threonine-protein phosphatase [Acidobacteriota bacterium]